MRLTDEQIGAELTALRESPDERFAAELDAWAAAGFPAGDAKESPRRPAAELGFLRVKGLLRRHPVLVGVAGSLAVVLAVGAPVASLMNEERMGDSGGGGVTSVAPQATDSAAPGATPRAESIEPAPAPTQRLPGPDEQLKPAEPRVQEKTASLSLSTEPRQVDDVADGVVDVTDRYDGIVVSSQVSTADGTGRATFDLRIPTQNLQAALADLSDLAHVASRNEGTLDITAPFVGAEERFEDARAAVDRLLDQLAAADSANEIAAIRAQLRAARQELAAARARLGNLKQRADFSALSVTVAGDGDGDGWSIGDAARDAVDVLEALGGALLIGFAIVVPLGAIGAAVWFGTRGLQRRRRESVLDR